MDVISMVKSMTGETNDSLVSTYLQIAGDKILKRRYPFGTTETEVPMEYQVIQVQIATYLINKIGAEGESRHSENGVDRTYESSDVPMSLLREVVPLCGVVNAREES